jgi:hypothetical protein
MCGYNTLPATAFLVGARTYVFLLCVPSNITEIAPQHELAASSDPATSVHKPISSSSPAFKAGCRF